MIIRQFVWDVVDSNSWLIQEGKHSLLIDAVDNLSLMDALMDTEDLTVILTHSHFDHICGLNSIREKIPNVHVVSTEKCSEYLMNPIRNMSSSAMAFLAFYKGEGRRNVRIEPFTCASADELISKNCSFVWNGHKVELRAVYGHTDDGLLAILDGEKLFSGDTLLPIPTVTRFPRGSTRRFWNEDMEVLKTIMADQVYPGHGVPGRKDEMICQNRRPEACFFK